MDTSSPSSPSSSPPSSSSSSSLPPWPSSSLSQPTAAAAPDMSSFNFAPSPRLARRPARAPIRWPMGRIPVEIFEIITSHLTRSEVKILRLVCGEFEVKVSARYFRNVVVPFRSELYGSSSSSSSKSSPGGLFSDGQRIFESFGPHILRFALALELDEDILAYPPVKPVQEAVPAFWGVYRWPHETYHRYTDLEDLEQTADETESMKAALRCLSKVSNLGLCCDAGLGFLVGPEAAARRARSRQPVFDVRDWRQPSRFRRRGSPPITAAAAAAAAAAHAQELRKPSLTAPELHNRRLLEKMVSDAGFAPSQVDEAIEILLKTESTTLAAIDFDERSPKPHHNNGHGREHRSPIARLTNHLTQLENPNPNPNPNLNSNFTPASASASASADAAAAAAAAANHEAVIDQTRHPLIPSNLTRAQKELLLEMEWAHRAMIQSYVISLIDNAASGCFANLTTLTIARIPSCHVPLLYRPQLWECFPSLRNVSLGVIADWRKLSKPSPGCVEDHPVSPVAAVSKVYRLLNDYVGKQANIESIRFEWICGGEFAPGSYQRNSYILPAPLVPQPELMVSPLAAREQQSASALLSLPFVKHLSLKNCWASPHVMAQTIRQMALQSLEKLELESVSLSGPPSTTMQPSIQFHALGHLIGNNGANPANLLNLFTTLGAQMNALQPAAAALVDGGPPPAGPAADLGENLADMMSWTGFMELFSSRIRLQDALSTMTPRSEEWTAAIRDFWAERTRSLSPFLLDADNLAQDEGQYRLQCILFKSCGYVCVDAPFINTRAILPIEGGSLGGGNVINHRGEGAGLMQHCRDRLLGRIVPYMRGGEVAFLEKRFGMESGWEGVYEEWVIEEAVMDGFEGPGGGRFSCVLNVEQEMHAGM